MIESGARFAAGDPCELTVVEAAAAIRSGQLSAQELTEACLNRIDAIDPAVQAWVCHDREAARAAAAAAADALAGSDSPPLLLGIPFGVKDIIHVAGLPTRAGSSGYVRHPQEDAECVKRLKQAGAVALGKTTTTAFAFLDPAPTRNPWRLSHTPGGSSSGSAAAVAARMIPFALGTQTGGSLCRPASYCGVVTLKPTYGRISRRGVLPLASSLDHVGVFTRTVADQALVLQALAADDLAPSRPLTPDISPHQLGARGVEWVRGKVIGIPDRFFPERTSEDVAQVYQQALRVLEQLGCRLETVRLPESFEAAQSAMYVLMRAEIGASYEELYREHPEQLGPKLRAAVSAGRLVPFTVYHRAQRLRRLYMQQLETAMAGVTALVTPASPTTAPEGLSSTGDSVFNAPFTLAGWPALALPAGFTSQPRLPVGLQFAALPYREPDLLMLGAAFQEATEWHRCRPPLLDD